MRTTRQLRITLQNERADVVRTRARAGECASGSEVIRDTLPALPAQDRAVERWLNDQAGAAYDALKAEPSRAVTPARVRARLAVEHAKARWIAASSSVCKRAPLADWHRHVAEAASPAVAARHTDAVVRSSLYAAPSGMTCGAICALPAIQGGALSLWRPNWFRSLASSAALRITKQSCKTTWSIE